MNNKNSGTPAASHVGDTAVENWKNVNNWHWVDKDCLPWTVSYVNKQLLGLKAEDKKFCAGIDKISSVKGDSFVNQRKGKCSCVFDLEVLGSWTLEQKNKSGEKIQGSFKIVEFAHDTDIPNIEVEFTPHKDEKLSKDSEKFLKENLTKAMGQSLNGFVKEMIDANYKDVIVGEVNSSKGEKTIGPGTSGQVSDKAESSSDTSNDVKQVIDFSASPMDLFDCLTDLSRIRAWTRSAADLSPVPGGFFSLLDGKISGMFEELVPGKKITQKWRLSSWDDNKYSKVSISISPTSNGSKLTLTQSSVPMDTISSMVDSWNRFYWWPIRDTFGFVCSMNS